MDGDHLVPALAPDLPVSVAEVQDDDVREDQAPPADEVAKVAGDERDGQVPADPAALPRPRPTVRPESSCGTI